MSKRSSERSAKAVRYAVIGQGYISQIAVLPAFAHARGNSRLVALVSDDPKKLKTLGRRYRVGRLCGYEQVDELFEGGEIDAVYIALPNSMHCDYTVRAAKASLHVLCEKPMAMTVAECERMIAAARDAGVKLMIAYRLHFERANLEATQLARRGKLGELRLLSAQFTMQVTDRDNIRLRADLGGGPLYDIGIYCINAARMLFGAEPRAVFAARADSGDKRFRQVPESVVATLDFGAGRIATLLCSFGAADVSSYSLIGTQGSLRLDPAFEYAEGLAYELRVGGRSRRREFSKSDQFAPELIHFSDCVLHDREPQPSGAEGLADVRVLEALRSSLETGQLEALHTPEPQPRRPTLRQELRRPAVRRPKLVHASPP